MRQYLTGAKRLLFNTRVTKRTHEPVLRELEGVGEVAQLLLEQPPRDDYPSHTLRCLTALVVRQLHRAVHRRAQLALVRLVHEALEVIEPIHHDLKKRSVTVHHAGDEGLDGGEPGAENVFGSVQWRVRRDGGKDELDGVAIGFGFELVGVREAREKGL